MGLVAMSGYLAQGARVAARVLVLVVVREGQLRP